MSQTKEQFLTKEQEERIVEAIRKAELQTSSEIRVHIEHKCKKDPLERARQLFGKLEMNKTDQQNGVLVYIATEDHKVAVFGGQDINEKVGQSFWDDVLALLIAHFKDQNFEEGIEKAVSLIGEKLKAFYPYKKDDVNELSDDISYNSNKKA